MDRVNKKYIKKEDGAVVIEATLSLTFFMFMIVMLLNIVNICTAQAKIAVALNETAKEISQYTYIYSLTGLNDVQGEAYAGTEDTRTDVTTMVNGVTDTFKAIQDYVGGDGTAQDTFNTLESNVGDMEEVAKKIANSENRAAWVTDIVKICANEGVEKLKGELAGALVKGLMQKHLVTTKEDDCDSYLKHLGIEDGLSGLDMGSSRIFLNGTDDIVLVCKYEVKIVNLLGTEYSFQFSQNAYTKVWGAEALFEKQDGEGSSEAVGSKFTLVGEGEGDQFGEYAGKAQPVEGYVDVIIHASADGSTLKILHNGTWVEVDHRVLANYLQNNANYNGENIRLISCGTGSSSSSIAQNLANKMNVKVMAPSDTVWAYPDGTLTIGPDAKSNTGQWNDFSPGNH